MTFLKIAAASIALSAFGGMAMAADSTVAPKKSESMQNEQSEQSNVKPGDPTGHNSATLPSTNGSSGASSGEGGTATSGSANSGSEPSGTNQQSAPSGKDTEAGGRSSN